MDHLLHVKPLPPPNDLKLKAQNTSTGVLKIKGLLHAFIFKHARRAARALGGARSLLLDLLNNGHLRANHSAKLRRKKGKNTTKPSARLDVVPVPSLSDLTTMGTFDVSLAYYDSSWNAMLNAEQYCDGEGEELAPIAGYLEWLDHDDGDDDDEEEEEEEDNGGPFKEKREDGNEIDRLAEKFIARCHERFLLEKQESYRRYHETLARSL